MIRTYRYKLYTNKSVEVRFNQWLGSTRFIYNIAKETKEYAYKAYGVNLTYYDLAKQLTQCRKEYDWLRKVNSQTLQATLEQLERSYQNFFSGRARYPKWAAKHYWKSFGFKQNIKQTDKGFKLPSFGVVKVHNNRKIDGKIKTARLIRKADGIHLHVVAEVKDKIYYPGENQIGVDMGIKHFAVTSHGEYIPNPRFLENQLRKLRIEQRGLSRKEKGSKRRDRQRKVVARLHKKVVDARRDFLHKTSTYIASNYSNVAIENLNIRGMVRSNLSRHITDVSWGTFFDMLEYKCNNLVRVDAKYTSQECSVCGHTCKENRMTQSIFKCVSCGHEDNADVDAAKIIEARAFADSRQREALACA